MIPRERLTHCLPFLHRPLGSALKKKKKRKRKKKAALLAMFLVHEYNHKTPFQCFISVNCNTDTNFTTTFHFVTSSLLLMGHVSFPIPLVFQSQVKDQPAQHLHNFTTNLQIFFCVKQKYLALYDTLKTLC